MVNGTFEHELVQVGTEDGSFAIDGLGSHEYALTYTRMQDGTSRRVRVENASSTIPIVQLDPNYVVLFGLGGGLHVNAPASGIVLEKKIDYAGFQVLAKGEPLARALCRVMWTTDEGTGHTLNECEADEEGRVLFAIECGTDLEDSVVFSAPGWAPSEPVRVSEHLKGRETFAPIELEQGPPPVNLALALSRTDGGGVGRVTLRLTPWPAGSPRPDQSRTVEEQLLGMWQTLEPANGIYHIDGLSPGTYWCEIEPSTDRQRPTAFELTLPARPEFFHAYELGPGGHLRVLGDDALEVSPLALQVFTIDLWNVRCRFGKANGGAMQTKEALDPGEYVLKVQKNQWQEVELPFEIVDGEVAELELRFEPR